LSAYFIGISQVENRGTRTHDPCQREAKEGFSLGESHFSAPRRPRDEAPKRRPAATSVAGFSRKRLNP
jgi:hypothetical protein